MSALPSPNYYFRPAIHADIPVVRDLHTYWLKNTYSVLDTEGRSPQWWDDNFSRIRKERLPFILAVCSEREFLSSNFARLPPKWNGKVPTAITDEFPNNKLTTTAADGTPEMMLGYTYALPFWPYPGYERTVEFSVYLIPQVRASGAQVGIKLEIQRGLILKFPHLYPNYGWDGKIIRGNVRNSVSTTLLEPRERELLLQGKILKIWAGLLKAGIEFKVIGLAEQVGEKFGKLLDMAFIGWDMGSWEPTAALMTGIHAPTVEQKMVDEMRAGAKL